MTEAEQSTTPYLVDEEPIRRQSDIYVRSDEVLQRHVAMINGDIDFIDRATRLHEHRTTDELIVQRLATRVLNSGAAALLLARSGYYNQCVAMVRDVMETAFLLDLFGRAPHHIAIWTNATQEQRDREYGAVHVRLKIERIEAEAGETPLSRKEVYKRFCNYGSHASPDSFVLISPEKMTLIGPFSDHGRFKAMVEEIVRHLTFATLVYAVHLPHKERKMLLLKASYYELTDKWANDFIRPTNSSQA